MTDIKISRRDVAEYKREVLQGSVLVSVDVAAEVLSVHTSTIYRYIQEGRINAYNGSHNRRSKGVRVLAEDLKNYVRSIKINRENFGM